MSSGFNIIRQQISPSSAARSPLMNGCQRSLERLPRRTLYKTLLQRLQPSLTLSVSLPVINPAPESYQLISHDRTARPGTSSRSRHPRRRASHYRRARSCLAADPSMFLLIFALVKPSRLIHCSKGVLDSSGGGTCSRTHRTGFRPLPSPYPS